MNLRCIPGNSQLVVKTISIKTVLQTCFVKIVNNLRSKKNGHLKFTGDHYIYIYIYIIYKVSLF